MKRSRFVCDLAPAGNEDEARAVIDAVRSGSRDARHHCTAFILGEDRPTERSNDDGEPSGTAGAPMLEVLRGHGLHDVVAVVTRWFGGTLLGTGGLTRAYGDCVAAALADADRRGLRRGRVRHEVVEVHVPMDVAARVENGVRALPGVSVGDGQWAASGLVVNVSCPPERVEGLTASIAALSAGRATVRRTGSSWVDLGG